MSQTETQLSLFDELTEPSIDLSILEEYENLTEVETAIKKRKEEIKKTVKSYMEENHMKETPPYKNFIGVLEERTSYNLHPIIMEAALPPAVFKKIIDQKINLDKVKKVFLEDGTIPVNLLRVAETTSTKEAFYIRSAGREVKDNKAIPFWRTR